MNTTLERVTSADGTSIAIERQGDGPPIVLVCGGSVDRTSLSEVANLLAADFSVLNFDRRGRGDSGDTLPYAIEREIEDIEAVIAAAGGSSGLFGSSSGAALALTATAAGASVTKLALWEAPYIPDPAMRPPADQIEQYETMVAEGRRGDAAEYFMAKVVGMPPEFVAYAKSQPWWASQEALAHTLAYDARIMGDYSVPVDRAAKVTVPTLVLDGSASMAFMKPGSDALAIALPNATRETLPDQQHNVDAAVLVPVLARFFAG
jgi:pimeloyl-ACP methyl ester carboxylesterase